MQRAEPDLPGKERRPRRGVGFWVGTALLGVAVGGCGARNAATVSGTVTLDGQPLTTGNVTFHPTGDGPLAYGRIGAGGSYELQTGSDGGLKPGDYAVVVVATEMPADPQPGVAPAPGRRLTPEKYSTPEASDLRFTVTSGANTIDLPLTSE